MTRVLPPLNALRAFEAAFRHESFARAAAELHVAQAAVSRHIRDFEIWLGQPLFERHARGVRLTPAGRRLGTALTPLLEGLAAAVEAERPAARRLVVTVEPVFAHRWLLRRLGGFRARHPEIDLILDPSDRLVDFAAAEADLGIRYGQGPWPGVVAEKLVDVEIYPVAGPDIAARLPPEPGMAALRAFTLLHEDSELWARWQRATEGPGAPPPRGLMLHDTHLAIEAAALGQGIALGDSILDQDDRAAGRLIRLTRQSVNDHAYWLVGGRKRSANARLFAEWLQKAMAEAMEAQAALPIR